MHGEEFLGGLYALVILGSMVFCSAALLWYLITGKDNSRREALQWFLSAPVKAIAWISLILSVMVFFALLVFGRLIFEDGKSNIFLIIPGFWVALGALSLLFDNRRLKERSSREPNKTSATTKQSPATIAPQEHQEPATFTLHPVDHRKYMVVVLAECFEDGKVTGWVRGDLMRYEMGKGWGFVPMADDIVLERKFPEMMKAVERAKRP